VGKFIRIGVDLAKNYFQVHALASEGSPAVKRKLTRSKIHRFFSQIEPSFIGMEACGSAHYWARDLKAMGHDVLLMPPSYIKPYVKRGKNDAVDAEAMSRLGMRFVPIKSAEQQATLMLHKTRELLVKQRTMSVNALRSHLSEFGITIAKGIGRIDELLKLAEVDTTLPDAAKTAVKALAAILEGIEKAIGDLEGQIADAHARSDMNRLPAKRLSQPQRPIRACSGQAATSPPGSGSRRGKTQVAASRRSAAKAGTPRHGGAGQQARPDHLGNNEDRRNLPCRDVREGVRTPPFLQQRIVEQMIPEWRREIWV
jgi:transposase